MWEAHNTIYSLLVILLLCWLCAIRTKYCKCFLRVCYLSKLLGTEIFLWLLLFPNIHTYPLNSFHSAAQTRKMIFLHITSKQTLIYNSIRWKWNKEDAAVADACSDVGVDARLLHPCILEGVHCYVWSEFNMSKCIHKDFCTNIQLRLQPGPCGQCLSFKNWPH